MGLVDDVSWCIESRLGEPVTLAELAARCGVSPHHLGRALVATTGCSVIRHHRGRCLTEAARTLAAGASSILEVALDAGYGSHAAFTRAFKDLFGCTPAAVRARPRRRSRTGGASGDAFDLRRRPRRPSLRPA